MQSGPLMTSYTQPNFDQIRWKKISWPICTRHVWFFAVRLSSTIWVQQFGYHGNILGSKLPQYFWPPLVFHFDMCKWYLICLIQQAHKAVRTRLWSHLMFCELKITNILKSSEWGLEKSELPWEQNFESHTCRCLSCRTISPLSFNGLCYKLTKIAIFIFNNYWPKARWILSNNPREEVEGIIWQYSLSLRWIRIIVLV